MTHYKIVKTAKNHWEIKAGGQTLAWYGTRKLALFWRDWLLCVEASLQQREDLRQKGLIA